MPSPEFDLYLVTDRNATNHSDLLSVLQAALDAGVTAIQLREKDLSGKELFTLAERTRDLTHRYHSRLFINDRADVALAVGADGVQLGAASLPADTARNILGPTAKIGVSTHSLPEALDAQERGADFILFGPIFSTPSKAAYGAPQGLSQLHKIVEKISLPVYAIGGINQSNLGELKDSGIRGFAVISAIISANDPATASKELLKLWRT